LLSDYVKETSIKIQLGVNLVFHIDGEKHRLDMFETRMLQRMDLQHRKGHEDRENWTMRSLQLAIFT